MSAALGRRDWHDFSVEFRAGKQSHIGDCSDRSRVFRNQALKAVEKDGVTVTRVSRRIKVAKLAAVIGEIVWREEPRHE